MLLIRVRGGSTWYGFRPSLDPVIAHIAAARPTAAAAGGSGRPGRGQRIVRVAQHARPAFSRPPSATRHLTAHHSARRANPSSEPLSPGRPVPSHARRARRRPRCGRPAWVGRAVHERRDRSAPPNLRRWVATLAAIAASGGGRRWAAAAVEQQAWSLRVARPSEPRLPSRHQLTRPSPSAAPLPGPRTCANERVAPWPTRPTAARPGRPSRRGPDRASRVYYVY